MKYLVVFVAALIAAVQSNPNPNIKISITDINANDAATLIKELEEHADQVQVHVNHADQSVVAAAVEGAKPVADEPVAEEPVADEPVADEPVAEEVDPDEPVAHADTVHDELVEHIAKMKEMLGKLLRDQKKDQADKLSKLQLSMRRDNLMVKIAHSLKDDKLKDDKVKRHKEIGMLRTLKQEKRDEEMDKYEKEIKELEHAKHRDVLIKKLAKRIKYDQAQVQAQEEKIAFGDTFGV